MAYIFVARIPHAPMPCPRPRVALRGRVPVAYYPREYQLWKKTVSDYFTAAADVILDDVIKCPVRIEITCVVARPKTTKLLAPKPDVDNYAKSVLDAMTTACVWDDDSQVVQLKVTKRWALPDEPPHIHVFVFEA